MADTENAAQRIKVAELEQRLADLILANATIADAAEQAAVDLLHKHGLSDDNGAKDGAFALHSLATSTRRAAGLEAPAQWTEGVKA